MFGLFGSKERKQAQEKLQWAQDASHELLMTPMELGGAESDSAKQKRLATPYGFGYIFGFSDALIQRAGVTDDGEIMAALTIVHTRLFGDTQGPKIFGSSLNRQAEPQFIEGRKAGGTEAMQWLSEGGKHAPIGLAGYLLGRVQPNAQ